VIETDTPSPEWIKITVRDSGPGVSEQMLGNVFSPFRTSKEAGMGLGLSISRSIANAHGGELTFENHPEGGACFYFTLPSVQTRD
jgi:signal transduction histidine kinase